MDQPTANLAPDQELWKLVLMMVCEGTFQASAMVLNPLWYMLLHRGGWYRISFLPSSSPYIVLHNAGALLTLCCVAAVGLIKLARNAATATALMLGLIGLSTLTLAGQIDVWIAATLLGTLLYPVWGKVSHNRLKVSWESGQIAETAIIILMLLILRLVIPREKSPVSTIATTSSVDEAGTLQATPNPLAVC